MTSLDELFRKPTAPAKRKLEDPTTSFSRQPSKSAKLSNGTTPHGYTNGGGGSSSKVASVQDEVLEVDEEDTEAGPSLPPDEDVEDEVGDDEEGRFFGGGVSKQEREVMDFIEQNEDGTVDEKIDSAWLQRSAKRFDQKIKKNAELRGKWPDDPMKYVGSEADLDTDIRGWTVLIERGELYPEFAKVGAVGNLVGLLAHENTDIAIAVCELLAELTDEDATATEEQWATVVRSMVKADVVDLLVSNLSRLEEESNEIDRAGVYHILNVVENMLSQRENLENIGDNASMIEWLLSRIKKPDTYARGKVSQNRQYAAEILSILLQSSEKNRQRFAKANGVDVLLELLSAYRKKDPEPNSDEEEFVENLFDCLTCVVEDQAGSEKFIESEGVELCLIMLREGKLSKSRSLRVLDHAMGGHNATAVCEQLIEAAGLKTVFPTFMRSKKLEREMVEHLIGMLASLLRYLPGNSAPRIRTLAKFVEKDYEKISRLAELRKEYAARVGKVDSGIEQEKKTKKNKGGPSTADAAESEDEWLSRRLDAGLFVLQTLDVILTWLVAEDDGARGKVRELLGGDDDDDVFGALRKSLQEQLDGITLESALDGNSTREMLEALIKCL